MDLLDHVVRIIEQVGFPIALVILLVVLAPRHALRMLEVFEHILDQFADKLLGGIRQVVERHESVVNRAEAVTARQEAAVSKLEMLSMRKWSGQGNDGQR